MTDDVCTIGRTHHHHADGGIMNVAAADCIGYPSTPVPCPRAEMLVDVVLLDALLAASSNALWALTQCGPAGQTEAWERLRDARAAFIEWRDRRIAELTG